MSLIRKPETIASRLKQEFEPVVPRDATLASHAGFEAPSDEGDPDPAKDGVIPADADEADRDT